MCLLPRLRRAAGPGARPHQRARPALSDAGVEALEASDPLLAESGLRAAGRWWAGRRSPGDPLVSPVNGSVAGLPPIDVFIGDRDILRPAVDRLSARAHDEGASLHVHEVPAMFHVWMTRAVPEGRRTRRQLARLVRDRLTGGSRWAPARRAVPRPGRRGAVTTERPHRRLRGRTF